MPPKVPFRLVVLAALLTLLPTAVLARQGGAIGTPNVGNGTFDYVEGGTNRLWTYDPMQDWWTVRTLPGVAGVGGDLSSRFNACSYGLIGNGTTVFYRAGVFCAQATGNVERLADAPFVPGRGAKVSSLPGYVGAPADQVFVLKGGDTAELWRYDILSNAWSRLPDVPAAVGDAGALDVVFAFDEATGQFAWQLAVLTVTGSSVMHLYHLERGDWDTLALPFTLGPGASLAGTNGSAIEVLAGGGREYWIYESWAGWQRRADTPAPITAGADMSFSGAGAALDTMVHPGDGSLEAWAYSPATGGWRIVASLPTDNQPPVAEAGPDQVLHGCPDCVVRITLDSSGSFDPDGDRLRFEWREGSRFLFPTAATVTGLGSHVITLTVRDSRGGIATDTLEILVVDPAVALQSQIAALQIALAECQAAGSGAPFTSLIGGIESDLAAAFSQPGFAIPGNTPEERMAALAQAIADMNRGARLQLLRALGGK